MSMSIFAVSALLSTPEFLSDGHRQHGFHPVLPTPFTAFLFSGKLSHGQVD
jgi:hypothetical protein